VSAVASAGVRVVVRRNTYADSVTLLQVTSTISALPDVTEAAVVMATDLNRDVLGESGLLVDEARDAGPNDLVVAVRAGSAAAADAAVAQAESLLAARRRTPEAEASRQASLSVRSAARRTSGAGLAMISVPGQYAAAEARQALLEGLNVFLFSDNVSIDDEIELKRQARERGLLVMGPDCGTAILHGVGLGFANAVRRGRIGLVAASGTGLQEVTTLLHRAGEGVSHAIGTGGRDLRAEVGAVTTLQALELLAADPQTETIVLISKPPAPEVAERVLRAAVDTGKPVIACLLGATPAPRPGVRVAGNLYQAARLAADSHDWAGLPRESLSRPRLRPEQDRVYGLYCGGTLAEEAELALHEVSHQVVDFGDDRYTRGRAHPMIDPTLRNQAILDAAADPHAAVLLLDVILGFGSHADPAGAAAQAVRQGLERAQADGRDLAILAHVVGTDLDPQGLGRQEATLREAGVQLFESNHHAAVAASLMIERARV
jgi:FdrA protein